MKPTPPALTTSVSATPHPLVARYSVQSSEAASVSVEFGPTTSYGRSTSEVQVSAGAPSDVLVAGMHPATTYHMRAVVRTSSGTFRDTDHIFTTGAPPPGTIPVTTVTMNGTPAGGVELLDLAFSRGEYLASVLDLDGSILWYYAYDQTLGFPYALRPMPNGDMAIVIGTAHLREVDLTGTTVHELTLDQLNAKLAANSFGLQVTALHHDVLPMPNGHMLLITEEQRPVLLAGDTTPTTLRGDDVIDLDPSFNPVWTWSAFDHLDVNRRPMDPVDWTHSNALIYSPADHNLLLSMRHQHWVLKLDYQDGHGSGAILWRLGPDGDFRLDSSDSQQWFYGQHFAVFADNTQLQSPISLALFDNRATNSAGTTCETDNGVCYSRAVILRIDESAMSATIQWQDRLNLYSLWGGSIETLPNGDVEYTLSNPFSGPGSRVAEVNRSTNQTIWQMDIQDALAYRAFRIPSLYPGVQW